LSVSPRPCLNIAKSLIACVSDCSLPIIYLSVFVFLEHRACVTFINWPDVCLPLHTSVCLLFGHIYIFCFQGINYRPLCFSVDLLTICLSMDILICSSVWRPLSSSARLSYP
jgi:hypothetical protein